MGELGVAFPVTKAYIYDWGGDGGLVGDTSPHFKSRQESFYLIPDITGQIAAETWAQLEADK